MCQEQCESPYLAQALSDCHGTVGHAPCIFEHSPAVVNAFIGNLYRLSKEIGY